MANTKTGKPMGGVWTGVLPAIALMTVLAAVSVAPAQQPAQQAEDKAARDTAPPPRARTLLRIAIDNYKLGDYELAAKGFTQVQANQNELSAIERADFKNFRQMNGDALAAQREGATQIRQAQEYLSAGKSAEAARLIKGLQANQYLSGADRLTLSRLRDSLHMAVQTGKATDQGIPNNEKALLAAARDALKRGELDLAAAYSDAADKVAPVMHFPLQDTPAKVRNEIAKQRKMASSSSQMGSGVNPDKKESSSPFNLKKLFVRGDDTHGSDPSPGAPIPTASPGRQPDGPQGPAIPGQPDLRQTIYPSNESGLPGGGANSITARKLVKEGYEALQNNDLDTARRKALQAKELRPNLEWWEDSPGRLLEDVQRRAARTSGPGANAGGKPIAPADARILIKEARTLLVRDKLDDAERLCSQAAMAPARTWGLFDDSPDKLRADIQKARSKRDREESVRLLAEARQFFASGNLQEAKLKAIAAQQLHGPYSAWDMGDRPQKLLEEIHRAEGKNGTISSPSEVAKALAAKQGTDPSAVTAQYTRPAMPPPLVSGTSQAAAKIRAVALLRQARELQKQGTLIEARSKALEADQLHVTFSPEEDSPSSVLVSLAAQCERTVDQLMQRVSDRVQNHPSDPDRFHAAAQDIRSARLLASTFRLDSMRIEQKAQWLQQAAASSGAPALASAMSPSGPMAGGMPPPPVLPDSPAGRNRAVGLEKLDKARLELAAGNLAVARRLAEDAYKDYGIQEEAAMVLRSIDADEHNHQVNMANRNADAGIDAYQHGEFRQAAAILTGIDMRLVQADKARHIGELMSSPQIQAQTVQLVGATEPIQPASSTARPGLATATDLAPVDDLTQNYRAMEEIQFQQMRDKGMNVQRTAMELFRTGRKAQAVDALKEYLDELGSGNFDAQKLALLKRPVENRMQQYRTVLAQEAMEKQVDSVTTKWNESAHQRGIRKTQEEVAEQLKLYRTLVKEGKNKEALAAALKAKELDPENQAADAAVYIINIKIADEAYKKANSQSEEMFLKALNPGVGPYVDMTDPVHFDPEVQKRVQARKNGESGFWSPMRDAKEREIERRLSEPISLSFKDTPLSQVIDDLAKLSGVNIVADRAALQDANISLDMPLNLAVEKIALKSALNLLLNQVRLTYVIKEQVLQITTTENAKGRNRTVTYPVADLVVPVPNYPVAGVADMNTALARHLGAATGMVSNSATPYMTPMTLPGATPVSSQSSGVGSSFATNGAPGSQSMLAPTRAAGATIEDLLIDLIQKTISTDTWKDVGGKGTIQYYPLGMALVVNQTQEVQEDVAALLQSLRRLQDLEVAIEMRLVSVSESFFEYIDVDFNVNLKSPTSAANQIDLVNGQFTPFGQVNSQFQGIKAITGLTPAGTLTPDLGIPIKTSSSNFSVPPFGGFPGTLGADGGISLGLAFLSDIQVFMFMEAAQGDRRLNIMQAPKLTVFNGQTANISVNDFQFFLTGVNINQANGQIFFTPNNQPFPLGVTMAVTPVVSADRRFVRLNLTPSLTNLANTNVPLIPVQIPVPQLLEGPGGGNTTIGQPAIFQMFFQQPTFTTITVNTTVNVPDGGTVLLGGLKTMSEGRNEYGPPILGKIPYLNRLFTNTAYGRDSQSLMIMVTPRIIINEEEEQIFTGASPQIPRP